MKNVLFVVYYFPPMGGSGVQRPLKFAKYLREFGWNPIILCPEPGVYHTFDQSLLEEIQSLGIEIHRIKAQTPFHLYSTKHSASQVQISDNNSRLLRKISRLFFYPDNKKGWIKPAIKKGEQLIREKNISLIFSTAPPFSNHMIGFHLKKRTGVPLTLDYRDSWTNNHFMTHLMRWQNRIMEHLENQCLESADLVIALDEVMLNQIKGQNSSSNTEFKVITHGYDPDDFMSNTPNSLKRVEGKLNFLYSGLFYETNQPDNFLKAIASILENNPKWRESIHLHFQGGLDSRIKKLITSLGLNQLVSDYGYVDHQIAAKNLKEADILWMLSNFDQNYKQIKSGKLFEYIGSGKPILALVHNGEASKLLNSYGAGYTVKPTSISDIQNQLIKIIQLWELGKLPEGDSSFKEKFSRKELTKELASVFNVIISR